MTKGEKSCTKIRILRGEKVLKGRKKFKGERGSFTQRNMINAKGSIKILSAHK